jgi:hypothetical protein
MTGPLAIVDGVGLFNGVGVVAVVLAVGILVWTGRLVPKPFYDAAVHDSKEWQTQCRLGDQERLILAEQVNTLLHEYGPTVNATMAALQRLEAERTGST